MCDAEPLERMRGRGKREAVDAGRSHGIQAAV